MKKIICTLSVLIILTLGIFADSSITITSQPYSAYGNVGDTLTFSVAAYGDNLKYAWYWRLEDIATGELLEEVDLGNECAAELILTGKMNDPSKKSYVYCLLSDSHGEILTSEYAEAAVKRSEPREIILTYQPSERIDCLLGEEVMISAAVDIPETELGTLSYQWYTSGDNAVKLDGETRPYLTVPTNSLGNFNYYCIVTNEKDGTVDVSEHRSEVMVTVKAANMNFADVETSAWYYENVNYSVSMGLLKGKSQSEFCPNDSMTTAEAITLACRIHQRLNGNSPLSDGVDVWYSTYMNYALENKLISTDFTSSANKPITRKLFAEIFSNIIKDPDTTEVKIADISTSSDYAVGIYILYNANILNGYEDNTFRPDSLLTRAEAATVATRFVN